MDWRDYERRTELITLAGFTELTALEEAAIRPRMGGLEPERQDGREDYYRLAVLVLRCCQGQLLDSDRLAVIRSEARLLDDPDTGESYALLDAHGEPELELDDDPDLDDDLHSPSPFD